MQTCALVDDLNFLKGGDETSIRENGVSRPLRLTYVYEVIVIEDDSHP